MIRRPRFVIDQGSADWWFVLKAPNGETVVPSETYPTKRAALKGIAAVKRYALTARIVRP